MTIIKTFPNGLIDPWHHTTIVTTETKIVMEETKAFKPKKAGTNGSHIFLLLDESGSMGGLVRDTIGGVNTLIREQAKDDIATNITIIKFEGGQIRVPIDNVNVKTMGEFKDYRPSGGTNLLDAVGYTLEKINALLKSKSKADRPSIFVQIITDGEENASRKFKKEQIQPMIKACEKADWIISYVGANVDAFREAGNLGVSAFAASGYNATKTGDTYAVMSSALSRTKSMRSAGMNYADIQANVGASLFTDEETKKMNGETK